MTTFSYVSLDAYVAANPRTNESSREDGDTFSVRPPPPIASPVFDAITFGASATASDNTFFIQNAINACQLAGGGRVIIPAGNFKVLGTLTITGTGVQLQGAGQYATVLTFANGSQDCIVFNGGGSSYINGNAVRDLSIVGTSKTGGRAVYFTYVTNAHVERVYITNCWTGVEVYIINTITLRDLSIAGIVGGAGCYGVYFHAPVGDVNKSSIELNLDNVLVNALWSGADGIWWDGYALTMNCYLTVLLDVAIGIKVMNTAASNVYYPQYGEFVQTVVDGASLAAVQILGGNHFTFTHCKLQNTSGEGGQGNADTNAVYIASDNGHSWVNEVYFVNCAIGLSKSSAVYTAGMNVAFTGCRFGSSINTPANAVSAVHLGSGAADTTIANCMFSYFGNPNNWSYGIQADAGSYRTRINGGNFDVGCLSGPFLNNSADSSTHADIYTLSDDGHGTAQYQTNSATGFASLKVLNGASSLSASAGWQAATGTGNSFVVGALQDNAGAPYYHLSGGPAVNYNYMDFNSHAFRSAAGAERIRIDSTGVLIATPLTLNLAVIGNYASDADAAAGGIPVGGVYRNGNALMVRLS